MTTTKVLRLQLGNIRNILEKDFDENDDYIQNRLQYMDSLLNQFRMSLAEVQEKHDEPIGNEMQNYRIKQL